MANTDDFFKQPAVSSCGVKKVYLSHISVPQLFYDLIPDVAPVSQSPSIYVLSMVTWSTSKKKDAFWS